MRGAAAGLGLVLAGWPLAAVAQTTAITPDTAPGRGLGTTVGQAGRAFTIDGGTRAGANLFHSFAGFDLGAGDTARWTRAAGDGAEIGNVVNRVTGGTASHISGVLDSTALPNASFYFVNPAGIVFGAGAQVNVPSAAYFSTAAELRFADGATFAVATPGGSTLSVAAPESFGFVGGQGAIAIDAADLSFTPFSAQLSLSASDVSITGSRFAVGGLDLVAVGDRTTAVRLADPLSAARGGRVDVQGSTVNVLTTNAPGAPLRVGAGEIRFAASNVLTDSGGAGRGGDIVLQGDRVVLAPDAFVISSARGAGAGGDVQVTAGTIDVDATGGVVSTGFTSTATSTGGAGRVALDAERIDLRGGALVGSTSAGLANSGDVLLNAETISVNVALIASGALGDGEGGDVRISAATIDLGGATVSTSAFGAGRPGDVHVDGETILISGGSLGSTPGGARDSGNLFVTATKSVEADGVTLAAFSFSPSLAGRIELRAPSIVLHDSTVSSAAFRDGGAGQVVIEADTLILDEVDVSVDVADGPDDVLGQVRLKATGDLVLFNSNVTSNTSGTSDAGRISIEGGDVELTNSIVSSITVGAGKAGQVAVVSAESLALSNAQVFTSTNGEGAGGDVALAARGISLTTESRVSSDAFFTGNAGQVRVTATDTLDLADGARITSEAFSGTGNGGEVVIDAGRINLALGRISSDSRSIGNAGSVVIRADEITLDGLGAEDSTGISSEALSIGNAGDVTIEARRSLTLGDAAFISSASFQESDAGGVTIRGGEVSILPGGYITSIGYRGGNSGDISITASKLLVQSDAGLQAFIASLADGGAGNAGDLILDVTGSLVVDGGALSSDTFASGDAGDLRIKAGAITLRNFASISSSTDSFGDAGVLAVEARTLTLEAGTNIRSLATSKSEGAAGTITVTADQINLGKDAGISTATFGKGDAGALAIAAKSVRIDGGEISSSASIGSIGAASTVTVTATDDLTLVNGGTVSTLSDNPNRAGEVTINAGQLTVDGLRSIISSANIGDGVGDAGRISITAANVRIANGGAISTDSAAGAAGDIEINVPRPGLVILEGEELPGLILTSSGPGTGGVITIADPLAVITNGAAILALGEQGGANVRIQSRYFIQSTDRRNRIDVAGEVKLDTGIYDVSSGTVSRDLSVLDASKVLRGQCPAARSTGAVSQLITRPVGPYAREPLTLGPSPAPAIAATTGACS